MISCIVKRRFGHPKLIPKMRRSDRKVEDREEIRRFLDEQKYGCLGLSKDNFPYVVPVSYGYKWEASKENPVFYFHGAKEGRKIDLMKANKNACFTVAGNGAIINQNSGIPCNASIEFESVIAEGKVEFVGKEESEEALDAIVEHYNIKKGKYGKKALSSTEIYKLVVENMSCKKR